MNFNSSKKICIALTIILSLFAIGCSKAIEEEALEGIKLNKGALYERNEGALINLNYEGEEYKKISDHEAIGVYDFESGNYIFEKDSKFYSFVGGKEVELNNIEVGDLGIEISKGGKYISLYRQEEGITAFKIINIHTGEYVKFEPDVAISGTFLGWIDEESVAYYGVSSDGVAGIYTYSLKDSKEELLYKIQGGLVHFFKTMKEGVIILQEDIEDQRNLLIIDYKNGNVTTISKDLKRIYDVVYDGENYYVLGEFKDSLLSIYKIKGEEHTRLAYDFPFKIKTGKNSLMLDENKNVLFIGSNDSVNKEEVYRISVSGSIRKILDSSDEYGFVR